MLHARRHLVLLLAAGATLLDDVLQFGPTPAKRTSGSFDLFSVIVPPGAAFFSLSTSLQLPVYPVK